MMTGTGLLPYIRLLVRGVAPVASMKMRAYRPYRPIGVAMPPSD